MNNKLLKISSFIIYIILLLYLTLLSRDLTTGFIWESGKYEFYMTNYFSIIPFKGFIYMYNNFSIDNFLINVVGNFILLMPFAYYIPNF